ncbi:hypothetical protein BG61_04935 [Caballeronia glathei]|uniref:Uncharacterized protein n=1 Tax=Caballeronia glathei TaxID=60547 RepID=A0A069PQ42_9BURK|nr:hypothetical protein BG61_04935 [Caballeronia glathei]
MAIWRLIAALPTEIVFARLATDSLPSATAPAAIALLFAPRASDFAAPADALSPSATADVLNERAFAPIAMLFSDALEPLPIARLSEPALAPVPTAVPEP